MQWLNYHHLYYFWVVCKEAGFAKAAAKLHVAQSSISLQIAKLEDFLGEKLMERGPRGFKLTEAGQITLAQAEEIFRQGNDLIQFFKSGKMQASFRIGALGGLSKNLQLKLLSPILHNKSIELLLEVGDPKILLDRLINYQLDAVLSDIPFPSTEAEPLIQVEITNESICLVARKKQKQNFIHSTLHSPLEIYFPTKSSPLTSSLIEYLNSEKINFHASGYIDDIAILRLLAMETDSIIAIPKIGVKRELENQQLFILHEFKKIRQHYYLIHRQKGKRHPMLTKLLKN